MSFPLIEFDTSLAGYDVNEPRPGYRKIEVRLLAGSLGAEIFGVDLSQPVDDETFAEIHQAWLDHQVVFFRNQDITPERYKAFATRFSDLRLHELLATVPGHPEIQIVAKESTDNYGAGHFWHSDVSFSEIPPMGSLLYAREVPDYGGDTLFANMYLAYDTLSDGMKEIIDQRQALHSATRVYNGTGGGTARDFKTGESGSNYRDYEHAERRVAHPMARTHPATGRRSLYVNSYFTVGIVDMKDEEALPPARLSLSARHQARVRLPFPLGPGIDRRHRQPLHPALRPQRLPGPPPDSPPHPTRRRPASMTCE